jgi:hypothetical protein
LFRTILAAHNRNRNRIPINLNHCHSNATRLWFLFVYYFYGLNDAITATYCHLDNSLRIKFVRINPRTLEPNLQITFANYVVRNVSHSKDSAIFVPRRRQNSPSNAKQQQKSFPSMSGLVSTAQDLNNGRNSRIRHLALCSLVFSFLMRWSSCLMH